MHDLQIPGKIPKLSKNEKIIQHDNLDISKIIIIKISRAYHVQKGSKWLVLRCSVFFNIFKRLAPQILSKIFAVDGLNRKPSDVGHKQTITDHLAVQRLMNKIILHAHHTEFPTFL